MTDTEIKPRTVKWLIEKLSTFPPEMEVSVEVHDPVTDARLWGPLWLAEEEGGEVNLFARKKP